MISSPAALWSAQWRDTHILVFTIGGNSFPVAETLPLLNVEEQARAARFHFPADRDRWMRSRALLRMTLAQRLGMEASAIAFARGPNGKPELQAPAADLASGPLHFNLSHSGDLVAVALSAEPVGVDVEQWENGLPVVDLADHQFRPAESTAIRNSAEPHLFFYRLWTAKEAVMKCTGLGMTLPPASIIVAWDAHENTRQAHRADIDDAFDIFTHSVPGAWTISAATRTPGNQRAGTGNGK